MKTFINFILIIIFASFIGKIQAQKLDGYILQMPGAILEGGGKIYVEDFENKGKSEPGFGTSYATNLKNALKAENLAYGSVGKIYNPWITTKLYEITDTKTEADYVITGEYQFSSSTSSSNNPVFIKETSSAEPKIPVCYYEFTKSSSASVDGKIFINANGNDTPVLTLPFEKKLGDSKTKAMEKPSVKSAGSFITAVSNAAINQYKFYFSPVIAAKTYKFKNLKGEERDYNKKLRKQEREIKDLADKGDVMSIGKMYKEILTHKLKDPDEGNLNLAMCYEIIGNYTKAKEHYEKSGDKGALNQINKLIENRNKLAALGMEVTENDFE